MGIMCNVQDVYIEGILCRLSIVSEHDIDGYVGPQLWVVPGADPVKRELHWGLHGVYTRGSGAV